MGLSLTFEIPAGVKTYYQAIYSQGPINHESIFYTVAVPDTERARRRLAEAESIIRFRSEWYFEKRSAATAEFIGKVAHSLYPESPLPLMCIDTISIDIMQFCEILRKTCKAGHVKNLSNSYKNNGNHSKYHQSGATNVAHSAFIFSNARPFSRCSKIRTH